MGNCTACHMSLSELRGGAGLPVVPNQVGARVVPVGGESPVGALGEGAHEGDGSWSNDGPPAGGAVAMDDFDAGVPLVNSVINGLLNFSPGPVPVFSGMDNIHFEEALEAQAAQRKVAFGAIVVGALLDGDSAGGAVSIGRGRHCEEIIYIRCGGTRMELRPLVAVAFRVGSGGRLL